MATIYWFTSTGNSLYAAKKIAGKINGKVMPVAGNIPASCGDDMIGIVFPVFFWGLPRMVEKFISELTIENKNAYIFAVSNYGGMAPGVLGIVNRLLKKKGLSLNYGASIKMVENYLPEFKHNDSEAFRKRIDTNIDKIADAISNKRNNHIFAPSFINAISYKFLPDENGDSFFTVSDACTGCGICAKTCPARNITLEDGKPVFGHHCEHCIACIHMCPVMAIDWKGKAKSKPRFKNEGVTLDELISFYS